MKTKSNSATWRKSNPATGTGFGSIIGSVLGLLTVGAAFISGYSYMKFNKLQRDKEFAQTEAAIDNMVNEGGPSGSSWQV